MAANELLHLRDPKFQIDMLEYVKQDPVHDHEVRPIDVRTREDRNIFFLVANGAIVGVLCVAFTNGLPGNINHLFDIHQPLVSLRESTHAIFYSVFRTDVVSEIKNVGAELINATGHWIRANLPSVTNFVTMSPIPSLKRHFPEPPTEEDQVKALLERGRDPVAKFHLGNGATVYRIIPNADDSDMRQEQSYGWMVNYKYTSKD